MSDNRKKDNFEKFCNIIESKLDRLNSLKGRWIIVSTKDGKDTYLYDKKLGEDRQWSYYLDCAVGFKDFGVAYSVKNKLKCRAMLLQVTDLMILDAKQMLYSWLNEQSY